MNINWDDVFAAYRELETTRCMLRKPTMDDASIIFDMMSKTEVTQYLGRLPMATHEEAVKQVEKYVNGLDQQMSMTWIICDRESGEPMGTMSLFNLIKTHCRAEIGYLLLPEWWGKGIMSEVMRATLAYGFSSMQLHSMMAQIDPANDASRHVLEKHGFVQEAYFREDFYHPVYEKFTDTVILSLIKPDWQQSD